MENKIVLTIIVLVLVVTFVFGSGCEYPSPDSDPCYQYKRCQGTCWNNFQPLNQMARTTESDQNYRNCVNINCDPQFPQCTGEATVAGSQSTSSSATQKMMSHAFGSDCQGDYRSYTWSGYSWNDCNYYLQLIKNANCRTRNVHCYP